MQGQLYDHVRIFFFFVLSSCTSKFLDCGVSSQLCPDKEYTHDCVASRGGNKAATQDYEFTVRRTENGHQLNAYLWFIATRGAVRSVSCSQSTCQSISH